MSDALAIGLIGCGRAAEHLYLPAFAAVTEATLVAVCDPSAERRELIAAAATVCAEHETPEALLADDNVQAVVIATPPETHVPLATAALATGRPLLIEKPLAPTLADARRLRADWCNTSTRPAIVVGFNRRYWQPVVALREVIERQHTIDNTRIEMIMTSDVGAWSPICGAKDPLDDLGSHQFDLLHYLFRQPVEAVSAQYDDQMTARVKLTITKGVQAECFCAQCDVSQERITVDTTGGRYQIRMGSDRLEPADGAMRSGLDFKDRILRRFTGRRSSLGPSYAAQLRHFVAAARGTQQASPTIDDALDVLAVVEAAKQSAAENGREITLS